MPVANENDPRIKKLPKWAQDLVIDLKRDRDGAKRALGDFRKGTLTHPERQHFGIEVGNFLNRTRMWLPPFSDVGYFHDSENADPSFPDLRIQKSGDGPGIQVSSSMGEGIIVHPVVSNLVRITTGR